MIEIAISGKAFEKWPFDRTIGVISAIGYRGLEIRTCETQLPISTSVAQAEQMAATLRAHHLTVTCLSTFTGNYSELNEAQCQEELDHFARFVDLADVLDSAQIRHWAGWRSSRSATEAQWAQSVKWMRRAADLASAHGKCVALETHHGSLLDHPDSILRYLRDVDRANVKLLYDAENLYHDQVDYGRETVKRLGKHIGGVHVKDTVLLTDDSNPAAYRYNGKFFWRKLINEAGVDHYSVLAGLREIGFEGFLTVETADVLPDPEEIARHEYEEMIKMVEHIFG